jgi:serine protease Do
MEEKKKESEKEVVKKEKKRECKLSQFAHLKAFGIAFLFFVTIIGSLLFMLVLIKYSSPVQDWVLDEEEKVEQGTQITITQEEDVIIKVVEEVSPSVASIAVSQLTLRGGEGVVDEISNIGTGFIVDPNGIIITNQHVVSDTQATYKVTTSDGDEYDIVEILRDDNSDIALLKVDATDLTCVKLGDSESLLVGQTVIAIGTPLGEYAGSVTTGVISGLNRSVRTSSGWFGATTKIYEQVIQTDAAVNPGNSGGPLISTEGKVIGVNFATTANADNISFALPINAVKKRLDEYRTYGKFIKPYLGISYQMISEYEAAYYQDVVAGALVVSVDPNGPASKVDIQRGDIITKIEGEELEQSLGYTIQSFEVGQEISLEIWRAGEIKTVKVTLEELD